MVRLSSPDKVLWPDAGLTKRDLRDYLVAAADRLLPQLADRPLSTKQHPRGVDAEGFLRKDLPDHAPGTIRRHRQWAATADREVAYAVVEDADDLAWFAQQNTVELHADVARTDHPDRPDHLVIDLDPGERDVPVGRAARWVRAVLVDLGLTPIVKTTGGRGVHVLVPIERRYGADVLRPLTLAVARLVARQHPDELTVEMRRAERGGRMLVDWSRSSPGATVIAAWSPRARPEATVAMPLDWDEVEDDLDPVRFTLATALDREDAWADAPGPQRLERARDGLVAAGIDLEDVSPRGATSRRIG